MIIFTLSLPLNIYSYALCRSVNLGAKNEIVEGLHFQILQPADWRQLVQLLLDLSEVAI